MLHPNWVFAVTDNVSPAYNSAGDSDGDVGIASDRRYMLQLAAEGAGEPAADHVAEGLGEHIHVGKIPRLHDPYIEATVKEKDLERGLQGLVTSGNDLPVLRSTERRGRRVGGEALGEGLAWVVFGDIGGMGGNKRLRCRAIGDVNVR